MTFMLHVLSKIDLFDERNYHHSTSAIQHCAVCARHRTACLFKVSVCEVIQSHIAILLGSCSLPCDGGIFNLSCDGSPLCV